MNTTRRTFLTLTSCAVAAIAVPIKLTRRITAEDLQPFCGDEWHWREWAKKPWTRDGFTYATEGRIIVRVPALPGIAENPEAPDAEARCFIPRYDDNASFVPLPKLPARQWNVCEKCGGNGDEPGGCGWCDDQGGRWTYHALTISHRVFGDEYLHLMEKLPEIEIAPTHGGEAQPLPFRFAGDGIGLLMSRFSKYGVPEYRPIIVLT